MPASANHLLKPFFPAIDGMRAAAIIMVFGDHYAGYYGNAAILSWGWVGVDLFFVISGFLITGILYDTLHKPNFFRDFYVRRTLRIFPLFYGFWIVMFLATPVIHKLVYIDWNRYLFSTVFYVGNFFLPAAKMGLHETPFAIPFITAAHPDPRAIEIGPFWTLCVEEQFYMVWPLVIWLVRSRRSLLRICLAIVVLAPIMRWAFYLYLPPAFVHTDFFYFSTYTRIDTLLIGAAIALWLRGPMPGLLAIRRSYLTLCVVPSAILALLLLSPANHWKVSPSNPIVETIGFTLIALTASGLLLAVIDTTSIVSRAFRWPPLIAIGRLSYGIYFFHALPLQAVGGRTIATLVHHRLYLVPIFVAILTYAAAWLSFRYFESPFLRLKNRFAPKAGHASDPAPIPLPGPPNFSPVEAIHPAA